MVVVCRVVASAQQSAVVLGVAVARKECILTLRALNAGDIVHLCDVRAARIVLIKSKEYCRPVTLIRAARDLSAAPSKVHLIFVTRPPVHA